MDNEYFRKLTSTGIILALLVLSFLLLKPFILVVFLALILAFLFYPLYNRMKNVLKSGSLSAALICIILALIIIIPVWFLTPIILKQSFNFFRASQHINFVTPLQNIFPDLFASQTFSQQVGSAISSFVTKVSSTIMNLVADTIINFPTLFLKSLVMFFTFFVALKEQERISNYIRSLLPFSKDIEKKLFESSRGITVSVVYGQAVLGIFQGLLVGAGLFIFNVPNALFLTIIASLAGIFPIIGTTIVWIPTVIYLFVSGNTLAALGVALFGLVASILDSLIKPVFISRRVNMHSALVLLGMVGGLFLFGIIGVILGPLILAYLFIILEIYRDKRIVGVFKNPPRKKRKG